VSNNCDDSLYVDWIPNDDVPCIEVNSTDLGDCIIPSSVLSNLRKEIEQLQAENSSLKQENEIKESEYRSVVVKCNTATQFARHYQKEIERHDQARKEAAKLVIENEQLKGAFKALQELVGFQYLATIHKLQSDNTALIECLKWYADEGNHDFPETGDYRVSDPLVWEDNGQRARECLSKLLRKDSEKTP
jgi:FtsZ-binding cell division protein ZapB